MITRQELAAALYKWADQDNHPVGKFIGDDGSLCCLGMIGRECLPPPFFAIGGHKKPLGGLLRELLGDDLYDYIEYANDEFVESGHPLHIVTKSIMNRYDYPRGDKS